MGVRRRRALILFFAGVLVMLVLFAALAADNFEGLVLCVVLSCLACIELMFLSGRRRKINGRYEKLRANVETYLIKGGELPSDPKLAKWMSVQLFRINYGVILLLLCVVFGACAKTGFPEVTIICMIVFGILIAVGVVLYASVYKVLKKSNQNPDKGFDNIWSCYKLHNFGGLIESPWSVKDMNIAVWMKNNEDYQESYEYAEQLWAAFGGKHPHGVRYLQYHLVQSQNLFFLDCLEEAEIHLKCVKAELPHFPEKPYYKKVGEMLEVKR